MSAGRHASNTVVSFSLSFRQVLVVLLVVATAIVLVPVGVRAASPQPVSVSSANGSNTAKVDSAGHLLVNADDDTAQHAFQQDVNFSFSGSVHITVPAGKRLAIRFISAALTVPDTQKVLVVTVEVTANATTTSLSLSPRTSGSTAGLAIYVAEDEVLAYADSGTQVEMNAIRSDSGGSASGAFSVSGYLVPCC
jgi:hypothetical protein